MALSGLIKHWRHGSRMREPLHLTASSRHQHGAAVEPTTGTPPAPQLAVMAMLERRPPDTGHVARSCVGPGGDTAGKRSRPKGWLGCALGTGWTCAVIGQLWRRVCSCAIGSRLSALELCEPTQAMPRVAREAATAEQPVKRGIL